MRALTALAEALAEEIIREGNIPEEQQEKFRQDFVTAFLGSTPLFDPVDISAVGRYDQAADTLTIEGLVLFRADEVTSTSTVSWGVVKNRFGQGAR